QQPPLHGWLALQSVTQVWLTGSQARPTGQSEARVQPQNVMLLNDTHAEPPSAPAQLAHSGLPPPAHWVELLPATPVIIIVSQQPPLHGWLIPQLLVQACFVVSQA